MKKIESVCLSGLGAVGCVYASLIHDSESARLSVVADAERIGRYARDGITINGKKYGFSFIAPGSDSPPADLVLIAVKQHDLDDSIRAIEQFVGKDTIIMSLLNGITSEELIGRVYGMEKVLRAFVVGTDSVREGTGVAFTNPGKIVFGAERGSASNEAVGAVRELFDRTGIRCLVPDDIVREQWWKFMLNVGINQVSAILRAPYGVFHESAEAQELLRMASLEVLAIAREKGIALTEAHMAEHLEVIRTLAPAGKTSMLQDVEARRKTEVELFAGAVMTMGRELGIPTPVNDLFYLTLRAIEDLY